MLSHLKGDRLLGLLAAVFALLLIFVWVPLDVDTGLVETIRRQQRLGDSLGPVVAGAVILIGAALTFVKSAPQASSGLGPQNFRWLAMLLIIITLALIVMRFSGPLITDLLSEKPYRVLRATPPWNYIGYVLGGTLLVATLISIMKGRVIASAILIGLIASLVIALFYDLPFDDLQLPPNGDV